MGTASFKDGKWARQLLALQDSDGKWGCFHSLSQFYNAPVTTEQALRRLHRLGFTAEDACIRRALDYMNDCLLRKQHIPDRTEKVMDWDVFTDLMLSTSIRLFSKENPDANAVAEKWAQVVTGAFENGYYNHQAYCDMYHAVLRPKGGRLVGLSNYYPIALLSDCLDEQIQLALISHIISEDKGIYYIYDGKISEVPSEFQCKNASRYIGAVELLANYQHGKARLDYVSDWLLTQRDADGYWDMGQSVNDKLYFPLSDDWRKEETRKKDCTVRIEALLSKLSASANP